MYTEGCSEDLYVSFFPFLFILDTLHLVYWSYGHFDIHYTYIWFSYILMYVLSPISPCVGSLFLYTCFLYNVCNLLFLFHTKMPWWVLFKVFQKYSLLKSTCHKLSSYKVFQDVCVRIDFIVLNKWIWVKWFMIFLISHLFVVVLSRIAKWGDC